MTLPRMTSSTKILVGLVSGVIVGLFFGEHAGVLKVVADGFVKLLQMMVLPYIMLSIITSLGTFSLVQVKTLGFRAGAVLLGLWCLALVFMFLIPLAFPGVETASFYSTTLVEQSQLVEASRSPADHFLDHRANETWALIGINDLIPKFQHQAILLSLVKSSHDLVWGRQTNLERGPMARLGCVRDRAVVG